MPTRDERYGAELRPLLQAVVVGGDAGPLESYLIAGSALPGPRMNLGLAGAFADAVAGLASANAPMLALEQLLDGWAALTVADAPVNSGREMLPGVAALAWGALAVARPDRWDAALGRLRRAATDRRWRTRELVATGLQRMLAADWPRTVTALTGWLAADNTHPLVIRAAAAAVAEPPLLKSEACGSDALAIQTGATSWLAALPPARRKDEGVPALRQALGFTLSIAVAAAPGEGWALLGRLAASPDPDLRWIVRENLTKNRLKVARWAGEWAAIQAQLATAG